MSRNKYVKDYRLYQYFDEKGKVHSRTEYAGAHFEYVREPSQMKRDFRLLLLCCAAGWLLFIASLIPVTAALHRVCFSLPFAFCAVPLWFVSTALFTFYRAEPPLTRRESDIVFRRLKPVSIVYMVLAFGSLAAFVIAYIVDKSDFSAVDVIPLASSAVLSASSALVFAKKDSFQTREI